MSNKKLHFEEYLYLPALTHDSAIIAWGGFFFEFEMEDDGEEEWKLLDDDKLWKRRRRRESIGAKSEPYAPRARVVVRQTGGDPLDEVRAIEVNVEDDNHAIVRGLRANTKYEYRVFVQDENGQEREWAAGPLRDWV